MVVNRVPGLGKNKAATTSKNGMSQIAHVRPSTPSAALEVMYGVSPLDLFIQNCAQNAAIRVQPDTTWQPPAKARARVAHGRHLEHQFPAGLCMDMLLKKDVGQIANHATSNTPWVSG
jgi:hypothetical protein